MSSVKFSHSQIQEVFDVVVALLNLGNVQFAETSNQIVAPTAESKPFFLKCASLLKCDVN
jgi:myosin heavy subunit